MDKNLYIGYAENLKERVKDHNLGRVLETKYRKPLKIVYYEACENREKAIAREKYFKTGFGRRFLKQRI